MVLHKRNLKKIEDVSERLRETKEKMQIHVKRSRCVILCNVLNSKRKRLLRFAMHRMIRSNRIASSLENISRHRRYAELKRFFRSWKYFLEVSVLSRRLDNEKQIRETEEKECRIVLKERDLAREAFDRDRRNYESALLRLRDDYRSSLSKRNMTTMSRIRESSAILTKQYESVLNRTASRVNNEISAHSNRVQLVSASLVLLREELVKAKSELYHTKRKLGQAHEEAEVNMKKYEDVLTHMRIVEASAERRCRRWIDDGIERKEKEEREEKMRLIEHGTTLPVVSSEMAKTTKAMCDSSLTKHHPRSVRAPKIPIQKSESGASPSMRASNIRKSIFSILDSL